MAELHVPHPPNEDADNPEVRHETSDVNIRAILNFGLVLTISGVVINFVVWLLFSYFDAREGRQRAPAFPLAVSQQERVPPEPRLQPSPPEFRTPREELADMQAKEEQLLTTYGWVDRNGGVVRIPIDEAMKLVVQRGLPARTASGGNTEDTKEPKAQR